MTRTQEWRLIKDDEVTGSFGLAADDCLSQRVGLGTSTPTLRLYTYRSHQALVGRFQNVGNEIRGDYCAAHNIPINRRPTGGGAIIMGADQLGVALCIPGRSGDNYARARELMGQFSAGIINGLHELGIDTGFKGKNDIEVQGKKLAGLGVYRAPSGGLLFHASILVNLDIALMLEVLNTPFEKISDRAIATVAERVTTINREVNGHLLMDDVRSQMAAGYSESFEVVLVPGDFTAEELAAIEKLESEKYLSDKWIYQTTQVPDTFGSAALKTNGGLLDIRVTLAGNTIKAAFIGGDFFASEEAIARIEASLRWHSADQGAVEATLAEGYQAHAGQLSNLPLESLQTAVNTAIRRARRAESEARANPYGCFVNPQGAALGQVVEEAHG
jgi:lipoate-protein ligase A